MYYCLDRYIAVYVEPVYYCLDRYIAVYVEPVYYCLDRYIAVYVEPVYYCLVCYLFFFVLFPDGKPCMSIACAQASAVALTQTGEVRHVFS